MFTALFGSRLRTATLLLLVAMIAFVPPLVRATARTGPEASSPLRLNRGFDAPPTKCTVVPPSDLVFESVQRFALPIQVERLGTPAGEPLPEPPRSLSPDTLRGPPLPARS